MLSHVRVVTMALNAPGPVCAAKLRDVGARVTKVEPPTGDPLESYCAGWYQELHAGIAVERLDLKTGEGGQRMRTLLRDADLFLSSQRPSALVRLGLDPDTLLHPHSRVNHLRCLNIVGDTRHPEVPGHDLTYLASAGLLSTDVPRTLFADVVGGTAAFADALLLLGGPSGSRAQTGLFDSLAPLAAPLRHGLTGPGTLLGGALPAYGVYPTAEGRVALAALEPHFRARLYSALRLPPGSALGDVFLTRTAAEWEQWAADNDLPLVKVRD